MPSKPIISCALFLLFVSSALAQSAPDFIFEVQEFNSTSWVRRAESWSYSRTQLYDYGSAGTDSLSRVFSGTVSSNSISLQEAASQIFAVTNSSNGVQNIVGQKIRAYVKAGGSVSINTSSSHSWSAAGVTGYVPGVIIGLGGVSQFFSDPLLSAELVCYDDECSGPSGFPISESSVINLACSPSNGTTFSEYPGVTYYPVSTSTIASSEAYTLSGYPGSGLLESLVSSSFTFERGSEEPVALINGPLVGGVGTDNPALDVTVSLSSSSYDPDNEDGTTPGAGICQTNWTVTPPSGAEVQYTTASPSFTVNRPGNWTVTLSVTDNEGDTASTSTSFTVGDAPELCPGNDPQYPFSDSLNCLDSKSEIKVKEGCGNLWLTFNDPVPTRGFPLKCNIHINTHSFEPSRVTAVGNGTFTYGMAVRLVSIGGVQHYVLLDGNGGEYDFGSTSSAPAGSVGVYSDLSVTVDGYLLQNGGAPEEAYKAGNFTYEFNTSGALLSITDPQGNVQILDYNGSGDLQEVYDVSTNKTIEFEYDTPGRIARIVENGGGAITHLSYSGNYLTEVTRKDALGNVLVKNVLSYNAQGLPDTLTRDDDSASTVNFTYIDSGFTIGTTPITFANYSSSIGGSSYDYSEVVPSGYRRRVSKTNAQSQKVYYDLDATSALVTRITYPTFNGATVSTVYTFSYDANYNMTSISDGATTHTRTYTAEGLLASDTDNAGRYVNYTYSSLNLTEVEDNVGTRLALEYTDSNQPNVPTLIKDGLNNTWTRTLNSHGQVTELSPPTGSPLGVSAYTYDENSSSSSYGYLLSSENGAGDATSYTYTDLGDVASVTTSPQSGIFNTTEYDYDAAQRVTQITRPDSTTVSYSYSGRQLDEVLDEASSAVSYTWCKVCGKLAGMSEPLGRTLAWTSNSDRQTTGFSDARQKSTSYVYGNAGELKEIDYPDTTKKVFKYDNYGRLVKIELPDSMTSTVSYQYNTSGNVSKVTNFPGTASDITYNADGTVATTSDPAFLTEYTYDAAKRVTKVIYKGKSSIGTPAWQTVDYTYTSDGLVATITWTHGTTVQATWTYSYDAAGRMTSVANTFGETTSYTYDGEGKLLTQTNQNSTHTTYDYNQSRGWPTTISHDKNGTDFATYDVTYDTSANTVGNITGVTELNGDTMSYTYDALYRLTGETRTGTNAYTKSYAYDLAGNVTTLDGNAFATYDDANKFATIPGGSATYNSKGELLTASGTYVPNSYYEWSDVARLTYQRNNTSGTYTTHKYDSRGFRVYSIQYSPSLGGAQVFIYAGDKIIGELINKVPKRAYTWGADGLVSERILGTGAVSLWYHFGPQGETRYLTNSAGNVADSYVYSAYGFPIASTGTDSNAFRYGGKYGYYTEGGNGLMLATYRWYSPYLMRWLSRDPIGYDGGTNLYEYVGGRPSFSVDADGLEPKSTWGGDDPGYQNPEEAIKDLEEQLKRGNLSQKEKEKIRRRIRELRRRPSKGQQHHCDDFSGGSPGWNNGSPGWPKWWWFIPLIPFPGNPVYGGI